MLVDEEEGLSGFACSTYFWLLDFGVNQVDGNFGFALDALKSGSFHLRVDFRTSDDNTPERDQPIDVLLLQTAHEINLTEVLDRNHQLVLFGHFYHTSLFVLLRVQD